jgi:hypothetical protein
MGVAEIFPMRWFSTKRFRHCDEGAVVMGWLIKVAVIICLLGVISLDAVRFGVTSLAASDDAGSVAYEGQLVLRSQRSGKTEAHAASVAEARRRGVKIEKGNWWIDANGAVHVVVDKSVETILAKHIPPLRQYLLIRASGSATPL